MDAASQHRVRHLVRTDPPQPGAQEVVLELGPRRPHPALTQRTDGGAVAAQEASLPFHTPDEPVELTGSIMEQFQPEDYPHLAEMGTDLIMQPGYDHSAQFAYGLELILDGLEPARDTTG